VVPSKCLFVLYELFPSVLISRVFFWVQHFSFVRSSVSSSPLGRVAKAPIFLCCLRCATEPFPGIYLLPVYSTALPSSLFCWYELIGPLKRKVVLWLCCIGSLSNICLLMTGCCLCLDIFPRTYSRKTLTYGRCWVQHSCSFVTVPFRDLRPIIVPLKTCLLFLLFPCSN